MEAMFEEFRFQARLKYLAFKRLLWLFEFVLLFAVFVLCFEYNIVASVTSCLMIIQGLRVLTEAMNHIHLSGVFNAPDRWLLYPFG